VEYDILSRIEAIVSGPRSVLQFHRFFGGCMALKIRHRSEQEVQAPRTIGKANQDLDSIRAGMATLPPGMVLAIEMDERRSVRGTKMLVTRAAKELGVEWRHWHVDNTVYARPVEGH
jgi:hypothetical protein